MTRPRNGTNKVYSEVYGLPPSEHELLFSIVEDSGAAIESLRIEKDPLAGA